MTHQDPIVITAAKRTAIGNFNGYFKHTSATCLGAKCIKATYNNIPIDAVIMGCVLPAGLGQAPARQAALKAGLSDHTVCTTVNKMCGSGMQAVILAHDAIMAETHHTCIAGGMENMTRTPYLLEKARFGYRIGKGTIIDHMMHDGLEDAYQAGTSMGEFAEACAKKYDFTREQQDAFASRSLRRAQSAAAEGMFNAEICSISINDKASERSITQDEGPLTLSEQKIKALKPAFIKDGTITAANASSISDGAAALQLMRQSQAKQLGLAPLAKIMAHFTYAHQPEWFSTAPAHAIKGLLDKLKLSVKDVDLFEINEAFAVVTLATCHDLKIPIDKVNIHGGACALGHPIGASGARILVTLIHALRQKNLSRGVAALCIGGGEATAIAIEIEDNQHA
jgi:acetyl-CoA C-acetyltransferase